MYERYIPSNTFILICLFLNLKYFDLVIRIVELIVTRTFITHSYLFTYL